MADICSSLGFCYNTSQNMDNKRFFKSEMNILPGLRKSPIRNQLLSSYNTEKLNPFSYYKTNLLLEEVSSFIRKNNFNPCIVMHVLCNTTAVAFPWDICTILSSTSMKTGTYQKTGTNCWKIPNLPLSHELVFRYLILKDVQNITMFEIKLLYCQPVSTGHKTASQANNLS